jgi:hypothetical protein
MGLAEVSTVLWRERELLELLLFKLEEEQLVLTSGSGRWLARATREVEMVLAEIRRTELLRATEVDAAAAALGLGPNPSLNAMADACTEPWAGLLREHRAAFLALTGEITALAETNRDLISVGARANREALLALTERAGERDAGTYTVSGATAHGPTHSRLMDEAL